MANLMLSSSDYMAVSELATGAEFVPKTAGFIPGLGLGGDCALAQAFKRQAIAAGIRPEVPNMVDVTDDKRLSVIPPPSVQAQRAQPALDCDILIVASAGNLAASLGLNGRTIRRGQRLVCLAPSARNPGTSFDRYGLPHDKLLANHGLDVSYINEMAGVARGGDYETPVIVMPGPPDVPRLIAVSKRFEAEAIPLDHPGMLAKLLAAFALNGLGAWIKKRHYDNRLDRGVDTRSGKTHAELLKLTRAKLAAEVEVGVEVLDGESHFFKGDEDAVMKDVFSGNFFGRIMTEIWTRDGIFTPTATRD